MCGICGLSFESPDGALDRKVIEIMTAAMSHRGPDGQGFYVDTHTGLGHRRLSIIDVEGGAQPMYNEDRSLVIVFNGEIYNYRELTPGLVSRGHRFATNCDTEVILHLYEEMGPRCVEQLNGMFAFAIWDTQARRLFLARDRLGEKPLYYHVGNGRLAFASELKALLKAPDIEPEVSLEALDDYLAYGYVPDEGCIIQGVSKLPPGCTLTWEDGQARLNRYWDVAFQSYEDLDEQEWMDELEQRLRDSIRIRLRSDVPLGVFLSGGVDSSGVVALASQEAGRPIKTFSVGFEEADYSEIEYARRVAERYKTEHQEIIVRDHDIAILPELAYALDEPFADPSALPTYHVCREARRFVTVCLSGDGGDEVFAGYTRYAQALRYQRMDRFTRLGARQLCGLVAGVMPRHLPGSGFMGRVAVEGAPRWFAQNHKFHARDRRELFRPEVRACVRETPWLFERFFDGGKGELLSRLQHADQKTYLPDDILVKVDRMSMKNSLELRVPFLDHTVVEFANRAPGRYKLRHGTGKYLLKKMLADYLPEDLLHRPKQGFGIPIRNWFRGTLNGFVREMLTGRDVRLAAWLEPAAVERVLKDHERGGRDLSERVWTLLMLELWCRTFKAG
ncbi:MAG TPA: asparagine synthase (glutamine-hydrolyzing) [Phycisphaerae bacterium]|jgi:asparagine synthase (glutamine-hydrolysing)|nr:asparagine synthase (glutamine-hydrolyzing) [Phycisphaerae bacterium]HOB74533.1 asparagine synthase (glutamine-hydrolyzing) [Phycisphaerae bacterium]HOJ54197.1 asparagine synthase (glutamine-hydrolyzing) [Phycisphaerae bacterium]HOL26612.1 asparagine synthase (glutamine-hydrolyzing) [Phycisphaerae bacterium]HPP20346.1 asparagine synthase (glutamine-hydrolyzing) [Phycisphaerae bacterium]